jgi:hypothetical protein
MTGAGWNLAAFSQLALASGQPVFFDSRRFGARSRETGIDIQSIASRSREIAADSRALDGNSQEIKVLRIFCAETEGAALHGGGTSASSSTSLQNASTCAALIFNSFNPSTAISSVGMGAKVAEWAAVAKTGIVSAFGNGGLFLHSACGVNCGNDTFFLLLLEMPPVCAPDAVNSPTEFFQDSLSCPVACSCNERTVVIKIIRLQ